MSERACCLIADGVGYEIRGRALVANASLTISSGEIVAVLGPNGAGKSTLLRLLAGELTPAAGRIVLADRDMSTLRAPDLARLRAVVAQASNLNFPFTVQEVVRLGVSVPGLTRGSPRIEATVADVIARVGLTAFSGRLFTELSGGERQRVHIARALADGCFCSMSPPRAWTSATSGLCSTPSGGKPRRASACSPSCTTSTLLRLSPTASSS
jgi:iron complex transport system ATP-binding protein